MQHKASILLSCTVIALGAAACSSSADDNTPTILPPIEADATLDTANTVFDVTLTVNFDDSFDTGDDVDAYTFQTTNLTDEVDDQDVSISPPSPSPVEIDTQIPQADDGGDTEVDFQLALFGATSGEGSFVDGTFTIPAAATGGRPHLVVRNVARAAH